MRTSAAPLGTAHVLMRTYVALWVATPNCVQLQPHWRRYWEKMRTYATPLEATQEDDAYICRPLGGDARLCTYALLWRRHRKMMRTYATPLEATQEDDAHICNSFGGGAGGVPTLAGSWSRRYQRTWKLRYHRYSCIPSRPGPWGRRYQRRRKL